MKNVDVSKVPRKPASITVNREKMSKADSNYPDRMHNSSQIQWSRWKWMNENTDEYINLMRDQRFNDEDIQLMLLRKKPLDFADLPQFENFKSDVHDLMENLIEKYNLSGLRFIQQGSSITGFSTNPRKGDRDIPNYIYNKEDGSDLDFRVYADNLIDLYDPTKGIELKTQPGLEVRLIEPSSAADVIPELGAFIALWVPRINQAIQLTLLLDYYEDYEPKPWDWEYL